MTPPKPQPPKGWPFDRHLWDDPVWDGSPLNPKNWPDHMRPIDVTDEFRKDEKNDDET